MKDGIRVLPMEEGRRCVLYIDGASRGNPGKAGAGVWITNGEGGKLGEVSRYLGHKTNNEAEYWALLLGLREAKRMGDRSVRVYTDSQLIERQVKGVYRVRDVNLQALHRRVIRDLEAFSFFEIESIPREQNREADRLANQAIQRRIAREKGEKETRRGTDGRSSKHLARQDVRGEESPSSSGQGGP